MRQRKGLYTAFSLTYHTWYRILPERHLDLKNVLIPLICGLLVCQLLVFYGARCCST